MKINWNYIIGVLLIALVGFLYGFSNHKNNDVKVGEIDIEFEKGENLFMNYQMVNKMLIQNGKPIKNKAKSVIDLHKLESNLLSHPMVENAVIFLTVNGTLKTKIKQRTPIARVITNSESYYIDKQATRMPLSGNHSARVIIVSGNIKEENNDEIHQLVSTILSDDFLKEQIIGIEKTPNNEFILETRIGEQKIYIGKIENLNKKFKNLRSFYSKTMVDNSIKKYASINLKYNNQVVCTKELEYGTQ